MGTWERKLGLIVPSWNTVMEVDRPEAQAIFISCSNFPTLGLIESLERKLAKPVVASNQASMWKMLRLMGDRRALPGAGRLFREA